MGTNKRNETKLKILFSQEVKMGCKYECMLICLVFTLGSGANRKFYLLSYKNIVAAHLKTFINC